MSDDGIPGLNADESVAWIALMGMTTWLPAALDVQLERDAGISAVEFGVMSVLLRADDRSIRIKDLARHINSALPRTSKVLNRLEDRGWVERRPDPDDGRVTLARLTDAGVLRVESATPDHVAQIRQLVFDKLTPEEVQRLTSIAGTILLAAGPEGACAGRVGRATPHAHQVDLDPVNDA